MRHALGCECIHIEAISAQVTVKRTADVRRQLRNELIAARNRKLPWSPKAFVRTVREMEHHDVVSAGIFAHKFPDRHPREWTKQELITLEEVTEVYMLEVTAECHCTKQQPMTYRFSTCLQLWQGKKFGYSWNSPTCAWR